MGGFGSGRQSQRATTEELQMIDIRVWHREGLLIPGIRFQNLWHQFPTNTGYADVKVHRNCVQICRPKNFADRSAGIIDYTVSIDRTPCHFGGTRPWFICPNMDCGHRVAILYADSIYACRRCYDLAYQSQRESASDRAERQAAKIRRRLGWDPGIFDAEGGKPKGMHWKTFDTLCDRHEGYTHAAALDILALLKIV